MITGSVIFEMLGVATGSLAGAYSVLAFLATALGPRRARRSPGHALPVSVIKPLCGAEPQLETCLRSFCDQDYPNFQIIFSLQDTDDPALAVARRVRNAYPALAIDIVVDQRQWGGNRKVSNLINGMMAARHDYLVVADSDIRVRRDYIARVCAPLANPRVGLVTCLYHGWATSGLWSRLGALFIDDWFMPLVLFSHWLGNDEFASGATLALRRETLDAIGGFMSIADHVADDYALGARIRAQGLSIALSETIVETHVHHPRASDLVEHETRWMRTIRSLQPLCYAFLFITLSLPLAAIALLLGGCRLSVLILAGLSLVARVGLRIVQNRRAGAGPWRGLWALPLRDLLTAVSWLLGLSVNRVSWRGRHYRVATDGSLRSGPHRD